ncbi:surf-like protein [Ceratobasidium sp. 428]|nr:surf-like protein [Ceratobasidium sp. 428]
MPAAHVAAKQQRAASSTGVSTRPAPLASRTFPTLASLAINVFAANFRKLFIPEDRMKPEYGRDVRESIIELPDILIPRVLAALRLHCPTYLNSDVLMLYFLRGKDICLTDDLPGATTKVLHSIAARPDCESIASLELSGLDKINDQVFQSVLSKLPRLEKLVLRGSSKAGPLALAAVASTCSQLKSLNMNYTVATPQSILSVLLACSELEVLKIAGIPKLITGCVAALIKSHISEHPEDAERTFPSLQTLKIRLTALSDADLAVFLPLCPNLTILDVSFTPIKHASVDMGTKYPAPKLRKLNLTSTNIPGNELVQVLNHIPTLEKLHLGALGESVPITSKGVGMGTGAGTITDGLLVEITDALARCENLKHIHLVGNLRIGSSRCRDRIAADFVRRVGRKCEILNLGNIRGLRSADIEGFIPSSPNDLPSPIRSLNLASTSVDDEAAIFIAACNQLEVLNLSNTRIGPRGSRKHVLTPARISTFQYGQPPRGKSGFSWTSPTTLVLGSIPIFTFGLGTWQIQRLQWKVALIDELEEKARREPLILPKRINLSVLPEFAYRRVLLTGTWDPDPSHTVILGPRTRDNVLGYHVISPLIRPDGASGVLVDRGFVSRDVLERARQAAAGVRPEIARVASVVADAADQGTVQVEGMIASSAKRNRFTPDNKPDVGEWYWADADAMSKVASGDTGDVQAVLIDELFGECPRDCDQRATSMCAATMFRWRWGRSISKECTRNPDRSVT